MLAKWYHCDFCGDRVREDDLSATVAGEYVCDHCVDDGLVVTCDGCYMLVNELVVKETADHFLLCPYCWKEAYICDHCEQHYMRYNFHEDSAGTTLCSACREEFYVCSECERFVHCDEAHWEEWSDSIYCSDCAPEELPIHDYSFKPDPEFYGDGPVYMGVELEVEAPKRMSSSRESVEAILKPEIYLKRDASLASGFEIVSHPCSLDYHLHQLGWEDILDQLRQDGFRSHDTETCGFHVHISRNAFGDSPEVQNLNIIKLIYVIEKFWLEMVRFSRRTSGQLDRWAARYLDANEETDPEKVANKVTTKKGRYFAINLENPHTVEVRLWRGTLITETFFATLQFCQFLVELVTSKDIDELRQLTWEGLLEMVGESGYEELISYMFRRFA